MNDDRLRQAAVALMSAAQEAVGKDRGATHGSMAENMADTAALWSAYLIRKYKLPTTIAREDVPVMMALLKISRTMHGDASFADHYIDLIGYASIAGALSQKE